MEKKKQIEQEKDFAETRMTGAKKISDTAKEKGGLSLLTWHHFKVKLPYYKQASEGKMDMNKARKEYLELLEELVESTNEGIYITQIDFQQLVGKIEVLGELLIKHEKGK